MRAERVLKWVMVGLALLTLAAFFATAAHASDYTRDGGTADYMCCADKACTTIISQHADSVRARDACGKLTDADGKTRYTRSNAFRITSSASSQPPTTGSVTLSWTPPTLNTDGTALTNLAGYHIVYGTSATTLTQTIEVANPGISTYIVNGLSAGSWYFAVRSVNSTGAESANSNTASKVIM